MDWRTYWNESQVVKHRDPYQQIGRTLRKKPYSEKQVTIIVDRILHLLQASPDKRLLELACGNGMLTSRIATHFDNVTAIDFSKPLIDTARKDFAQKNIEYLVGDAVNVEGASGQYDCVLIYLAFQYLTPDQARTMFANLGRFLRKPARILLGEVADGDRVWNFYRGPRGRARYIFDQLRRKPIIGNWWTPTELLAIAHKNEMDLSVFYQNSELPNYYFRYDALLETRNAC
jgi:cyclopropane fatty-acyl-phospholipid synthase-like methyltransferase